MAQETAAGYGGHGTAPQRTGALRAEMEMRRIGGILRQRIVQRPTADGQFAAPQRSGCRNARRQAYALLRTARQDGDTGQQYDDPFAHRERRYG